MASQSSVLPFVDVELNKLHRQNSYFAFDRIYAFEKRITPNDTGTSGVQFNKKFSDGEYTQIIGFGFSCDDTNLSDSGLEELPEFDHKLSIFSNSSNKQILGTVTKNGVEGVSMKNLCTPYYAHEHGNRQFLPKSGFTSNNPYGINIGDRIGQFKFPRNMSYVIPPLGNITINITSEFLGDINFMLKCRIYKMEFKL